MQTDLPYEEILNLRRNSAADSLRLAEAQELEQFVNEFFVNDQEHPWHLPLKEFIQKHEDEPIYRGETADGYGFVFSPSAVKGIWFCNRDRARGIGLLGPAALDALKRMVDTAH